ncbi:elongation factor Ts [Amycolatopsis sp. MJM2582]|uniref:Elongation factor Ts n=2 Tax=Amycolatopsis keratiniphila TaxID=129921 RepID=R4TDM5_9PSEU|nr:MULTISPECIES: translation elongation factor Ts [Amycolatopsis]AGM08488.1 elongation factor EF-Ts [Amycolatopsis keratiniphila]KFZ80653.1 elongation factor Ts [Amycolatopsis sp. MJM2582]OLZ43985.1 translation elongation factor Ts [Amycolatopsis keratiniphila subsp. nogabecina]ONF72334.1 translation elongation factor Ts [Amycolatopsis keratiniphila subsp. keratiniphila]SDU70934.1 elongation factor Ts [Amycolatopsis keratiniphila]
MANYTAADVKRLRELTGSGMMNCKKALEENDGDFDKAVEFLRIKGAKDVGKRAERATAEGLVAGDGGVLIELDSETDFVAKNEDFQALAAKIVEVAKAEKTSDVEKLKAASLDGKTVEEQVQELAARIGEKLELRRVAAYEGTTTTYLHRRGADLPPAVGVLIEYTGEGEEAAEAARGAAMQVAALKAKYLTRDEVPAEVVENERRVAEATAREEGKPEQAMPKIIEGKVNAYYKDNVLLEQPSVKDNKKTVKALLDEAGVTVSRFARFEVGQA